MFYLLIILIIIKKIKKMQQLGQHTGNVYFVNFDTITFVMLKIRPSKIIL
jgi:hypothetical protein